MVEENKVEEKESIWDKWKDFVLGKRKSANRPQNTITYGDEFNRFTVSLPKTVYEQLELVNLYDSMSAFPYDFKLKMEFVNKILPYTTYLNKKVNSVEELSYADIETLIIVYGDGLLLPLSQRGRQATTQTIEELLRKM
jgi:hypothetical protein